jgi:hypothetical protein
MKMLVFRDVAPCCLADVYRCFRCLYCHRHQGYQRVMSQHLRRQSSWRNEMFSRRAPRDRGDTARELHWTAAS